MLDITRVIIVDVFVVAVVSGMPIALDGTLVLVKYRPRFYSKGLGFILRFMRFRVGSKGPSHRIRNMLNCSLISFKGTSV